MIYKLLLIFIWFCIPTNRIKIHINILSKYYFNHQNLLISINLYFLKVKSKIETLSRQFRLHFELLSVPSISRGFVYYSTLTSCSVGDGWKIWRNFLSLLSCCWILKRDRSKTMRFLSFGPCVLRLAVCDEWFDLRRLILWKIIFASWSEFCTYTNRQWSSAQDQPSHKIEQHLKDISKYGLLFLNTHITSSLLSQSHITQSCFNYACHTPLS